MLAGLDNKKAKTPAQEKQARADSARDGNAAPEFNAVWQSLALRPASFQPKLSVSQPGDPYEQEADRVADQVMRMTEPQAQRKCGACVAEEEEEKVHRKTVDGAAAPDAPGVAPPSVHRVLSSPGTPLPDAARSFMEPRLGMELTNVRMHTDADAGRSARAIDAHAYTVGNHVVFAPGAFEPHSNAGLRLLAHELTHVAQQAGGLMKAARHQGALPKPSEAKGSAVDAVSAGRTTPAGRLRSGVYVARTPAPTPQPAPPTPAAELQQAREASVTGAISFIEGLRTIIAGDRARARSAAAAAGGTAEASRRAHPILNQAGIRVQLAKGRGIYEAQRRLLDSNHAMLGNLREAYALFLGEVREAFDEALAISRNDRAAETEEEAAYGRSLLLWLEASPLRDEALAGRTTFTAADVAASQRQETDLSTVLTTIVPTLNLVRPGESARARAAIEGTRARITTTSAGPPTRTTATGPTQTAADTAVAQINGAEQTIDRGRVLLRAAIARLDVWLQAPTQPIDVADRVNELFNTRDPGYGRLLRDRLQLMLTSLEGGGTLFAHMHRPGDTSTCATPSVQGERPRAYEFVFCRIGANLDYSAAVLLHELAHAVIPGRGTRGTATAGFPLDRAYAGERLMLRMTAEEALNNAESYAHLIRVLAGVPVQGIPGDTVTGCADNVPLLNALALAQSAHRRAWSHLEDARVALNRSLPIAPWLRALINTHLSTPAPPLLLEMLSDLESLQTDASVWFSSHTFACVPARDCPSGALALDDRRVYRNGSVAARRGSGGRNPRICPAFFALGADDRAHAAHVLVSLSFSGAPLRHPEHAWGYAKLALAIYRSDFGAPPAASLAEHQAADAPPATPTPTPTPTPTTRPTTPTPPPAP